MGRTLDRLEESLAVSSETCAVFANSGGGENFRFSVSSALISSTVLAGIWKRSDWTTRLTSQLVS